MTSRVWPCYLSSNYDATKDDGPYSTHFFMTRCIGVVFGTSGRCPTRSGRADALFDPYRNRKMNHTEIGGTSRNRTSSTSSASNTSSRGSDCFRRNTLRAMTRLGLRLTLVTAEVGLFLDNHPKRHATLHGAVTYSPRLCFVNLGNGEYLAGPGL